MMLELLALVLTPVGVYKVLRGLGLGRGASALFSAFWTIYLYAFMKYVFLALGILALAATLLPIISRGGGKGRR